MRLASYWVPEMESAYAAFREGGADVDSIAATIKASLDRVSEQARRAGYTPEQVKESLYAMVAWIDEMAMSLQWPGAATWRLSPLQRHYFSTTRAGVGFFERLEALPENETEVREVYALMLVAGFQGDFAHRPAEALQGFRGDLLDRVAQEVGMAPFAAGYPLFPEAYAPRGSARPRRAGPSAALLLTLLVPVALLVILYMYLNAQLMSELAELITPLTEGF